MAKSYLFICSVFVLLVGSVHAQNTPDAEIPSEIGEISKTNIPKAYNLASEAIEKAQATEDYQLAGIISKTPLYQHQPNQFLAYFEELQNATSLSFNERVYVHHQLMRYYVSVEADFDESFKHLIHLRELLEQHEELVLHPVVLGDVYYIAYWINHVQHDLVKSREYADLLLEHARKHGLDKLELRALMGHAELDHHEGNPTDAIEKFKALESRLLKVNDSIELNRLYLLISNAFVDLEKEDSAFVYGKKAYHIVPAKNTQLKAFSTIHVARGYINQNNPEAAIKFASEALDVVKDAGAKKEIKDIHQVLADAYKSDGNYKQALHHIERFLELDKEQASLLSAANVSNLEAELEQKQHALEMQKQRAEVVKRDAEIAKQKTQTIALIIGLVLAIAVIIISIRSYLSKKKAAETIAEQKMIVEEKNREILDSIAYAKRIQSAILPPMKLVKSYLNESFIFYKPKDIVAGDFYWMEPQNDRILFAACDCTGHGVPGAMVSVVCNNGLNRAVREFGLTDPGKILDKTRAIVIEEFEKSEEEVQDGMDVALCALEGNKLSFAGANNPLWLYKKDNDEVVEIKGDKQPIGKYTTGNPFQTHTVELEPGDSVYVFSDGYQDQFGGAKGKKYKSGKMKKFLASIQHLSMEEQRLKLQQEFEAWKGDLEQLDDVCIIGVKI